MADHGLCKFCARACGDNKRVLCELCVHACGNRRAAPVVCATLVRVDGADSITLARHCSCDFSEHKRVTRLGLSVPGLCN